MATVVLNEFHGLLPAKDARRLPAGWAQVAENVRFDNGDIQPLRAMTPGVLLDGDIGNLHWYRFGDDSKLIAFGSNFETYGARTPVPNDVHRRWYWNLRKDDLPASEAGLFAIADPVNPSPAGVAAPVGAGANFRQYQGFRVGIPAPVQAPSILDLTVQPEVGHGTDNAVLSIARTNPITINTAEGHDFINGHRVRIKIDESLPKPGDNGGGGGGPPPGEGEGGESGGVGQIWALDGLVGIVSSSGPNQFDITGISATGFLEFHADDLAAINISRELLDSDLESRSYVFTYVSQFDEEGPPSPPSNVLDLPKLGTAVQITLGDVVHDFDVHGGSRDYVNRIRIYRTVAGTSATTLLFVGELPFAGGAGNPAEVAWVTPPGVADPALGWNGVATEAVGSISLGEPLQSQGWFPPPKAPWGMHLLPNGMMVLWKNNTLHFSEPYLPHAWDPDNTRTTDDDILGVQSYGNTLVIGTRGRPYIATGVDPQSINLRKLELHAPLLHRRAMLDAGTGVFYPSTNGLVWISGGSTRYLTDEHFDKKTWEAAILTRPQGVFHDRRALFFAPGVKPLMADINGQNVEISEVDIDIGAAVQVERELFVVTEELSAYRRVQEFKRGNDPMNGRWVSGLITVEKPLNFAAGQVYADAYPLTIKLFYANLGVTGQPNLADLSEQVYVVSGPEAFRMQANYLSREFVVEVLTTRRVQQVLLATSMGELRKTR